MKAKSDDADDVGDGEEDVAETTHWPTLLLLVVVVVVKRR